MEQIMEKMAIVNSIDEKDSFLSLVKASLQNNKESIANLEAQISTTDEVNLRKNLAKLEDTLKKLIPDVIATKELTNFDREIDELKKQNKEKNLAIIACALWLAGLQFKLLKNTAFFTKCIKRATDLNCGPAITLFFIKPVDQFVDQPIATILDPLCRAIDNGSGKARTIALQKIKTLEIGDLPCTKEQCDSFAMLCVLIEKSFNKKLNEILPEASQRNILRFCTEILQRRAQKSFLTPESTEILKNIINQFAHLSFASFISNNKLVESVCAGNIQYRNHVIEKMKCLQNYDVFSTAEQCNNFIKLCGYLNKSAVDGKLKNSFEPKFHKAIVVFCCNVLQNPSLRLTNETRQAFKNVVQQFYHPIVYERLIKLQDSKDKQILADKKVEEPNELSLDEITIIYYASIFAGIGATSTNPLDASQKVFVLPSGFETLLKKGYRPQLKKLINDDVFIDPALRKSYLTALSGEQKEAPAESKPANANENISQSKCSIM